MGNTAALEQLRKDLAALTPEGRQEVKAYAWALVHDSDKADRLREKYKAQGFDPTRRSLSSNQINAT